MTQYPPFDHNNNGLSVKNSFSFTFAVLYISIFALIVFSIAMELSALGQEKSVHVKNFAEPTESISACNSQSFHPFRIFLSLLVMMFPLIM